MKEDLCYIALNPEEEKNKASSSTQIQKTFELPDGATVNVNTPRFMAPEALFNPDLIKEGDETLGMHKLCFKSITDCDLDVRKDLYENIILSGGSTMYDGLPDRVESEVDKMCPQQGVVKVIATKDRYYSVWTGGSTLSSLSTFESQWITKEEYEENGAEIVHRKCV
jgi:actin